MFKCDCCGLCCRAIGKSDIYKELDRGDGVCLFLDEESNLCKIYSERPIICNVDQLYELFFKDVMTLEEYYEKNYTECENLKKRRKL